MEQTELFTILPLNATSQQVFDHVVRHLFAQGKRAKGCHTACALRTKEGLTCAIGCLIPEIKYNKVMELDIYGLFHSNVAARGVLYYLRDHYSLLDRLRNIHDHGDWSSENTYKECIKNSFYYRLRKLYDIDISIIDTLHFPKGV